MRISDWSSDVCSSDLQLAVLHDRDPICDLGDHAEIMRNEQHTRLMAGLQLLEQTEDLGLCRDIQRRRRLVCDDDGGLQNTRHSNHGPLTLPTVKFVRLCEFGRASCRERVCQYVSISVVVVSLKNQL